ncbi:MAG: alpha/beta hydrolase [Candidatus Sumerlaeota bacterium]|nr:alpha/beta hydrolase [Candidatus Sumerlaeota bacterium]
MRLFPQTLNLILFAGMASLLPSESSGADVSAAASQTIALWPGDPPQSAPGNTFKPTLDIYRLETQAPCGAVLICPGGGYGGRAAHEGKDIALRFNKAGYHAFVVQYRVSPNRHPAPLMDVSRALRIIRNNATEWKVKPDHIAVCGFSAGGHLTATIGTKFDAGNAQSEDPIERQSSRPDALILCYPVISFTKNAHTGSAYNLLGKDASPEKLKEFSAELNVTEKTPPSFLWHTADDKAVPVENSFMFAEALHKNKVPFEMHIYPSGPHGMGLAPQSPHIATWSDLCCQWLKGMGW